MISTMHITIKSLLTAQNKTKIKQSHPQLKSLHCPQCKDKYKQRKNIILPWGGEEVAFSNESFEIPQICQVTFFLKCKREKKNK